MKNLITLVFIFIFGYSYAQPTGNYIKGDDYEGVSFYGESMIYKNKGITAYFTPTVSEIDSLESIIELKLNELKTDKKLPIYIIDNLKDFKRQYFGYVNKSGERIIYINFFHSSYSANGWREGEVVVKDGGNRFWRMKWNLSTDNLFDLYVNGES